MPEGIRINLLGSSDEVLGRSLAVRVRGKSVVTPAAPISLRKGRYVSSEYIDVAEVGVEINKKKIGLVMKLTPEAFREVLEQSIRKRIESFFLPNSAIKVVIVGFRLYGESINTRYIITAASELGHALGNLINDGLIDITCSPFIDGRNAAGIKDKIITAFYGAVSEVTDLPSVAHLVRLETYEKDEELIAAVMDFPVFIHNVLCIDFGASNPVAKFAQYKKVLDGLVRIEESDNELILRYGVNVQYSRAKRKGKLPARDLLGYYFGLDLVGENHRIIGFGSRPPAENLRSRAKILIRRSYGYFNIDTAFKERREAVREEYGKTFNQKIARIISEKNTSAINALSRQNFVKEVKGPITQLMSGKGYGHYDSALDYLRSKDVIKWHDDKALKFLTKLTE